MKGIPSWGFQTIQFAKRPVSSNGPTGSQSFSSGRSASTTLIQDELLFLGWATELLWQLPSFLFIQNCWAVQSSFGRNRHFDRSRCPRFHVIQSSSLPVSVNLLISNLKRRNCLTLCSITAVAFDESACLWIIALRPN